jgi:hypothetical protein
MHSNVNLVKLTKRLFVFAFTTISKRRTLHQEMWLDWDLSLV